ncbi:hypothetical protein [Amycolatopsis magusensis]|uniref:hypothetical protein n=1 Tax=Amycolatopsis magusensis TaxID=882444 RepID=UPI003C30D48E
MGEHSEKPVKGHDEAPTQALPPVAGTPARAEMFREEEALQHDAAKEQRRANRRATRLRIVGLLAAIVRWVGLVFALVLAVHVILVVGGANPDNGITQFIGDWAEPLALGFGDLFTNISDPKAQVLVNYGIAAIFWLIVSSLVAKIIRRVGGA